MYVHMYMLLTYIHIHTYIHTYIHIYIHTYIYTYIHVHMNPHVHRNIHTYLIPRKWYYHQYENQSSEQFHRIPPFVTIFKPKTKCILNAFEPHWILRVESNRTTICSNKLVTSNSFNENISVIGMNATRAIIISIATILSGI